MTSIIAHDIIELHASGRTAPTYPSVKAQKVISCARGALNIRDSVARRAFTGFLKKFFRFSLAGGVVRVALPGRTFPTLSLSSPVER